LNKERDFRKGVMACQTGRLRRLESDLETRRARREQVSALKSNVQRSGGSSLDVERII
jgi:hypothetical protein